MLTTSRCAADDPGAEGLSESQGKRENDPSADDQVAAVEGESEMDGRRRERAKEAYATDAADAGSKAGVFLSHSYAASRSSPLVFFTMFPRMHIPAARPSSSLRS